MSATPIDQRVVPARQATLWRLLVDALGTIHPDAEPAVLDVGGGTGALAVPLAELGARVTVVDISVDALATLRRRADEAGVGGRITAMQGDVEALADALGPDSGAAFDLVLAHGLLAEVEDRDSAVAGLAGATRPGGLVSLLVGNPAAAVLSRVIAGDLSAALSLLRDAPAGLDLDGLLALCAGCGLVAEQIHGVGVFAEFASAADPSASAPDAGLLGELEVAASGSSPYRDIAARVHVLARRPG